MTQERDENKAPIPIADIRHVAARLMRDPTIPLRERNRLATVVGRRALTYPDYQTVRRIANTYGRAS